MGSIASRVLTQATNTLRTVLSQIVVSVATAISVALITNAYFDSLSEQPRQQAAAPADEKSAAEKAGGHPQATAQQAAAAKPEMIAQLPKLEPLIIADRPVATPPPAVETLALSDLEEPPIAEAQSRFLGVKLPRVPGAGGLLRGIGAAKDKMASWIPGRDFEQAR